MADVDGDPRTEAARAREHWSRTESQRKQYPETPPFYARTLARVAARLEARSVLEIGCNAGRNLHLLRSQLPAGTTLKGFDVNEASIAVGREQWQLDLEAGDETWLARQPAGAFDLVFTVSVLDHMPAIDAVVRAIHRVTRRYFLLVEPHPDASLAYLLPYKRAGELPAAITTQTPYSYTHDYDPILRRAGFAKRLDLPMPPYRGNLGPLYRLAIHEKAGWLRGRTRAARGRWRTLRDEIVFDAIFRRP